MEVKIYDKNGKIIANKKQDSNKDNSRHYELLLSNIENKIEFVTINKSKKA